MAVGPRASIVRGSVAASQIREYLLPLIFFKRFCDQRRAKDWRVLCCRPANGKLGACLTDALRAVARVSGLGGAFDHIDFNARWDGRRIFDDDRLALLMTAVSQEPGEGYVVDVLGRAHQHFLREFSEGESTGDHYTPDAIGELIAQLLDPSPGADIYDAACGSGALLLQMARYAWARTFL